MTISRFSFTDGNCALFLLKHSVSNNLDSHTSHVGDESYGCEDGDEIHGPEREIERSMVARSCGFPSPSWKRPLILVSISFCLSV
ncbi:hypothetical protein CASFOL_037283 [Castilleja foliolosa]|uniref:Uncharacterized protein n=1 Tax=Castilleja foliolosa TaxID=1961234 RepID=A0ABD3BMY7_9LAMI